MTQRLDALTMQDALFDVILHYQFDALHQVIDDYEIPITLKAVHMMHPDLLLDLPFDIGERATKGILSMFKSIGYEPVDKYRAEKRYLVSLWEGLSSELREEFIQKLLKVCSEETVVVAEYDR